MYVQCMLREVDIERGVPVGRTKPKERLETSESKCRAVGMPARVACAARLVEARLEVGSCELPRNTGPAHRSACDGRYQSNSTDTDTDTGREGRGESKGQLQVRDGAPPGGQVARARDPLLVFGECLPVLAAPLLKPRGADAGGRSGLFSLSCKAPSVVYTTWDPHTTDAQALSEYQYRVHRVHPKENCHSLSCRIVCAPPNVLSFVDSVAGSIGIIMMAISANISETLTDSRSVDVGRKRICNATCGWATGIRSFRN